MGPKVLKTPKKKSPQIFNAIITAAKQCRFGPLFNAATIMTPLGSISQIAADNTAFGALKAHIN